MKKSYFSRLICLAVAGLILCSALAAAAISGSPYEILKNAAFNGLDIKNGTIAVEASIELDGIPMPDTMDLNFTTYRSQDAEFTVRSNGNSLFYSSADYNLSRWYRYGTDEDWYHANIPYRNTFYNDSVLIPSSTEYLSPAQRRFFELLLDLFVGDLKNNLSMSEKDGIRYIKGALTSAQIPAIVDAGLDLVCAQSTAYINEESYKYYEGEDMPPPKKLRITYVQGEAEVDKDGNLLFVSGDMKLDYIDIFDNEREISITAFLRISDIGTTVPECPIPGVKELLDEYKHDDIYRQADIRFKLNEDGTIDRDSVFDNMADIPSVEEYENMGEKYENMDGLVFSYEIIAGE